MSVFLAIEVIPNVWLGNKKVAENESFFKKENVTSVLNITKTIPNFFIYDSEIEYVRIPVTSNTLPDEFYNYFNFITEYIYKVVVLEEKKILIHDNSQFEESLVALMIYIIKYYQKTPDETIHLVKNKIQGLDLMNVPYIVKKWFQSNN
jgi:hypothetical protein